MMPSCTNKGIQKILLWPYTTLLGQSMTPRADIVLLFSRQNTSSVKKIRHALLGKILAMPMYSVYLTYDAQMEESWYFQHSESSYSGLDLGA